MASRFAVRFITSAALLMAAVLLATYLLRAPAIGLTKGARLVVALVPVPLAIWTISEFVRVMRAADEFARRVMLEALAIAYPVALLLGLSVEYLQKAGFLLEFGVGRLWPVQALLWIVAYLYAQWRYR